MSSLPSSTRGRLSRTRQHLGDHKWTRTRAVLSLGMVFGLGAVGTMAAWSDTATATTGTFTTSAVNVELKLNSQHPVYQFAALSKINLTRGASVAGTLPVNNTGDADFTYTAKAVASDAGTAGYGSASAETFASNLTTRVFAGGTSNGSTCSGGTEISATQLQVGSAKIIDTARRVNVGSTDQLCLQISLNSDAPLQARMSALQIGFEFAATQV